MILSMVVEKLGAYLQTLKPLVDRYEQSDPNFATDALAWLKDAEELMASLRLPEGSELSALRGRILKSADLSAATADTSRSSVRRTRNAAAAESLERAEQILRNRVIESQEKLQRFEDKLCEGITGAAVAGFIPPRPSEWMPWIALVWKGLNECPNTRALAIYMASSLTSPDRFVLLDRVMNRLADSKMPTHIPGS